MLAVETPASRRCGLEEQQGALVARFDDDSSYWVTSYAGGRVSPGGHPSSMTLTVVAPDGTERDVEYAPRESLDFPCECPPYVTRKVLRCETCHGIRE